MSYERYKPPGTVAHLQGVAEPDDAEISTTPRAGTVARVTTIAHLHRMHDEGYLTGTQLAARHQAAEDATTDVQLAELIADLPNLRPIVPPYSWGNRVWYTPILLGTTAGSAILALVPALTIGGSDPGHISRIGVAVIAITMVIGIIGIIASLVTLGCKLTNDA